MESWIASTAQTVVILAFAGSVFSYVVLVPLNSAIKDLREMIAEIRKEAREREEKRQEMDLRIVKCEESSKSAHHRIDRLEGRDIR